MELNNSCKFWSTSLLSNFVYAHLLKHKIKHTNISNTFLLAHYSSSRKGSAFYHQQIKLNRTFRARHTMEYYGLESKLRFLTNIKYAASSSKKYAPLSGIFPYFSYFIKFNRQIRSKVFTISSLGSLNTFLLPQALTTLNGSTFRKKYFGQSIRGGHYFSFYRWAALANQFYTFSQNITTLSKYRDSTNNLVIRSKLFFNYTDSFNKIQNLKFIQNWILGFWSGQISETLLKLTTSLTYFVRTVWYRVIFNIMRIVFQHNNLDFSGRVNRGVLSWGAFSGAFANEESSYHSLLGLSHWSNEFIDPDKNSKQPTSARKRRFFNRKHFTLRIGLGFWGKKLWQFKKSRKFWLFMQSVYCYFFRSYKAFQIYQNRLDVFVVRFFSIRNILYARSLIKAGHVFVGNYNPRNPKFEVERHALVSLSRKATIWTAGKNNILKKKYHNSQEEINLLRRTSKTAALRYARQQKDLYIYGGDRFRKFVMFYGEYLDVIFADSKKSKFFSLNFFYAQKTINSSWW